MPPNFVRKVSQVAINASHYKKQISNPGTDEPPSKSAKHLSSFQVEKFTFMFNKFFDVDNNGVIEAEDVEGFTEKLRAYNGCKKDSKLYLELTDVNAAFYECIRDQLKAEFLAEDVAEEEVKISWEEANKQYSDANMPKAMNLQQWLNMWGRLCLGSSGISDFPIWVQLLPGLFFRIIDKDEDGILGFNEIKNFYEGMIGIKDIVQLEKISKEGYRAMTANGEYKMNKEHYLFVFANFLLAKDIYGPGKYIFGAFDSRDIDEKFSIKYDDYESIGFE